MSNIVADACPEWCVTDHAHERGPTIVHNGQREIFGECTIAFDDGPAGAVVMYPTSTTGPDGGEVRWGMVLNGRFLDEDGMRALVGGLQGREVTR